MSVSLLYRVGGVLPPFLRAGVVPPASPAPQPVQPASAMPWLQRPARGEAVKELQRLLQERGIDCGPLDGYLGPVTEAAVRRFQGQLGLVVDGQVGPQTWRALGRVGQPRVAAAPPSSLSLLPVAPAPLPGDQQALRERLLAHRTNWASGQPGQCLSYANRLVVDSGGQALVGAAAAGLRVTHEGQGRPVAFLDELARTGVLRVGDVVLANPAPGQAPGLVRHWFTYLGQGEFLDQRGIKTAAQMAAFLPGREITAIHHPFG